jgi:hypothetical protein
MMNAGGHSLCRTDGEAWRDRLRVWCVYNTTRQGSGAFPRSRGRTLVSTCFDRGDVCGRGRSALTVDIGRGSPLSDASW